MLLQAVGIACEGETKDLLFGKSGNPSNRRYWLLKWTLSCVEMEV